MMQSMNDELFILQVQREEDTLDCIGLNSTAQLQISFVEIISRYHVGISLIENRFPVIFHTLKVLRIIQIICDCTVAVHYSLFLNLKGGSQIVESATRMLICSHIRVSHRPRYPSSLLCNMP